MKFLLLGRKSGALLLLLLFGMSICFSVFASDPATIEVNHDHSEAAAAAPPRDDEKNHPRLVRLDLFTKAGQQQRRHLQKTPQEEEGNPQVVDALYQGYGEHVSPCSFDLFLHFERITDSGV